MCGIAGIYNTDGEPPDEGVLARMASSIAHRGPDGERFFVDGGLGLAHRHLRIIDLSDAAMQPMSNEDGSLQLIFNGEIYNYVELRPGLEAAGHKFRSHSDSETILHSYEQCGFDCLRRFNGMFAFALWDAPRRRLFLARDRIGVKPLYYRWDGSRFVFGSEIKALLRHPQVGVEPNLDAVGQYMSAMYTEGEQTWFKGIKRLLPGHYIIVENGRLEVARWWSLPEREDDVGEHTERNYIEQLRGLLEDSVKLRLRSDVPIGSHLSGGLDSSAVVALLSKEMALSGERVRTFSGAFGEGEKYDERRYVRHVVERYGTEHHEVLPEASDLPLLMERMTWHMDEPAAGPGILLQWAVCSLTREAGVKVVNGGQGGDEAWGGYYRYIPAYIRTLLATAARNPHLYSHLLRDMFTLASVPGTRGLIVRAIRGRRSGRLRPDGGLGAWAGDIFRDRGTSRGVERTGSKEEAEMVRSPLAEALAWDLTWYLPALLQVEDRASMAFSLESRAPLLDYRIIELSARVPSLMKMRDLETKRILRRAVKDLLPEAVYRRKDKMGMPTPLAPWFRGPLHGWVRDDLARMEREAQGLFVKGYVDQALAEHLSGRADRSTELWKILSVGTWWRLFVLGGSRTSGFERPVREPLVRAG